MNPENSQQANETNKIKKMNVSVKDGKKTGGVIVEEDGHSGGTKCFAA